jgi:hypothetical protein
MTMVLIKGEQETAEWVRGSYPPTWTSRVFPGPGVEGYYDWGFVFMEGDPPLPGLKKYLDSLQGAIPLKSPCLQAWAAGRHRDPLADYAVRTPLAQSLYEYKYKGAKDRGDEIAARCADFIKNHPLYAGADAIMPLPANEQGAKGNAQDLAHKVADLVGLQCIDNNLRFDGQPRPAGAIPAVFERLRFDRVNLVLDRPKDVKGKSIILFDDIHDSEGKLESAFSTLSEAQVRRTLFLAVTCSRKGMGE